MEFLQFIWFFVRLTCFVILVIPMALFTGLIWILGGWTQEDGMPNPLMGLTGWLIDV